MEMKPEQYEKIQPVEAIAVGAEQEIAIGAEQEIAIGAEHEIAVGAEHEIAVGAEHGIAVGAEHGIAIGAEHGIAVGAEHEIAVGAEHGITPAPETEPESLFFVRPELKRLAAGVLLWCILGALLVVGIMNANALREYPTVSLRYKAPITGQAAYQARLYAIRQGEDNTFWPTFWHEAVAEFESEYVKVNAKSIHYSGDAALVWPARYLSGTAPGVTDGFGCAVSSELAFALWGSGDVLGAAVEVDGKSRVVLGVFEGRDMVALLSVSDEDTGQAFTAVELSGGIQAPSRSEVTSFALTAGLGAPDSVLLGTPAILADFLAVLPLLMLFVYGLVLLAGWMRRHPTARRGVLLLVFLGFAILLPGLLDMLPDRLIPTRWSDFSFWGGHLSQMGNDLREYLTVTPMLRDLGYEILFFKQLGIAFLSVCATLCICLRGAPPNYTILRKK